MKVKILIPMLFIIISLVGCNSLGIDDLEPMEDEEVVTFSMFSEDILSHDNNFSSPVALEITKATGVRLEYDILVGDITNRTDIMIASKDYPDLIMVKNPARFVDAGALVDLAPLIDQYGPNIKALYGEYFERLRYSGDSDAIYVLPAASVPTVTWEPNMGFALQHDVVKTLGYPEMKTVQDFEYAIKAYMEMYPEINGQETIGLSLLTDDWRWLISLGNGAGFATGAPDDGNWYIDPESYEAIYRFLRPEEKEYFRWLNHMYDVGLLDPESFVQSYEVFKSKIASGRVLGLIDAVWEYTDGEMVLRSKGMQERTYGLYPVQLDESTLAADFRDVGYLGGYGISISVDCEDPVKAIQFIDFMASDEGMVLRHWGIEGEHYYYNDEGRRVVNQEDFERRSTDLDYFTETGVGAYIYPFPSRSVNQVDSTGSVYNLSNYGGDPATASPGIESEVLEAYGINNWGDLYPQADELPDSDWGAGYMIPIPDASGINETLDVCDTIVKEALITAIVSDPSQFDLIWEKMLQDLEAAGVYEMNEAFTVLVKERVDAWKTED